MATRFHKECNYYAVIGDDERLTEIKTADSAHVLPSVTKPFSAFSVCAWVQGLGGHIQMATNFHDNKIAKVCKP